MSSVEETIFVTILMAVYNEQDYICEAIESILNQTYSNFEFIIIDDASSDKTVEKIQKYNDTRIRLFCNSKNIGLTKSLNKGIKIAQGKYILRIDGDDVAYDNRIEKQVKFMESHPEVKLASCGYIKFGNGKTEVRQYRLSFSEIKEILFFDTVLPHPGFIFDREALENASIRYDGKMKYAQDYDFQERVAEKYKIAIMPDVLFKYRVSRKQISVEKFKEQQNYANFTRRRQLKKFGIKNMPISLKKWGDFCTKRYYKMQIIDKIAVTFLVGKLCMLNKRQKIFSEYKFRNDCMCRLKELWFTINKGAR